MAVPKTIHIMPNGSGAWVVRTEQSGGKVFATQAEAVRSAQATVRDVGGQLVVQTADGQRKKTFTLGRAAMAKFNAVEGLSLTPAGKSAFETFDQKGLTPAERRAALRKDVAKLAGATSKVKKTSIGGRKIRTKGSS